MTKNKELKDLKSVNEFWPIYLSQHSKPSTKKWHFVTQLLQILSYVYAFTFNLWLVPLVPIIGNALAYCSHLILEHNIPTTYPIWSSYCDYKMFGLMLTGQMDKELKRLGIKPV